MMEALWGPRRGGDSGPLAGSTRDSKSREAHGVGLVAVPAPPVEAQRSGSDHRGKCEDASDLRQQFDALLSEVSAVERRLNDRMADLAARVSALAGVAPAVENEDLDSVRAELVEMRSSLDAAIADRSVSGEALHAELSLLEAWEQESAARLAALEGAVGAEMERLSIAVDAGLAERVKGADLDALRRELVDVVAAALSALEGRVVTPADHSQLRADLEFQMVEQLRQVLQEALQVVDARVADMGSEINARFDGSISKADFDALRSELKEALSTNMASAQAALRQRVAVIDATLAGMQTQVGVRLEQMAALVATEAAAAAERATLAAVQRRLRGA